MIMRVAKKALDGQILPPSGVKIRIRKAHSAYRKQYLVIIALKKAEKGIACFQ